MKEREDVEVAQPQRVRALLRELLPWCACVHDRYGETEIGRRSDGERDREKQRGRGTPTQTQMQMQMQMQTQTQTQKHKQRDGEIDR